MLDKRIPYKDLIMKWEGNRQCPMPVSRKYGWECRWGLHGQPWSYEAVNLYIKAVFFCARVKLLEGIKISLTKVFLFLSSI